MSTLIEPPVAHLDKQLEEVETVTIRFAGDSGDGMQLTGTQFTNTSAVVGNDISTLPDFPAEIRAPAGSLPGVSGFQLNFSSQDIKTPGDQPNVLVAMNPAALKVNLPDLEDGGTLIVNTDGFTPENLKYANYATNPLEDNSLAGYRVHKLPISTLNMNALKGNVELSRKEIDRSKNFFALGVLYWLYDRPMDNTLNWIQAKFAKSPELAKANEIVPYNLYRSRFLCRCAFMRLRRLCLAIFAFLRFLSEPIQILVTAIRLNHLIYHSASVVADLAICFRVMVRLLLSFYPACRCLSASKTVRSIVCGPGIFRSTR